VEKSLFSEARLQKDKKGLFPHRFEIWIGYFEGLEVRRSFKKWILFFKLNFLSSQIVLLLFFFSL
jgi:hypothetical protein